LLSKLLFSLDVEFYSLVTEFSVLMTGTQLMAL